MELRFSPAEEEFRLQVRDFLRWSLPSELSGRMFAGERHSREDLTRWHRILHIKGWSAPAWPREFGGPGWSVIQQFVFDEECSLAGAPPILPFGVYLIGPVLIEFGSCEQQERFLPRILSGEDWWCQGYSEPGAGSDLAALQTRAERVGDSYVVNGQKTWNSFGQHADWIFCLVRTQKTDRPQAGISFLLIDMRTPGVSVRPIPLIDGSHEVNEIWFENVVVPATNLVGEENKGWTYAKYLLQQERVGIAQVGPAKRELEVLKRLAARHRGAGKPLLCDARFRDRIAELEIELTALEMTLLRMLTSAGGPGPLASVVKIRGAEILQDISEAKLRFLGPLAVASTTRDAALGLDDELGEVAAWSSIASGYFSLRKLSIFGGSNEIQRNIIARQILRL